MQRSISEAWKYVEDRFGVSRGEMEGFELERSSGDLWLVSRGLPESEEDDETRGLRFLRERRTGFKPTTYALQFLGDRIERSRVELEASELRQLLEGGSLDTDLSRGYAALVFRDRVVGCGRCREGELESVIPKGRAEELLEILSEE